MKREIEVPQTLFDRLANNAKGFDTPAIVIERLLDFYEKNKNELTKSTATTLLVEHPEELEIVFHLPGENESKEQSLKGKEKEFQKHLLKKKKEERVVWVLLIKKDGESETKMWKARGITKESSILGNLRSGYLRGWKQKGIVKAEIAINKQDLQGR